MKFDFLQLLPGGPSRKDHLGQEIPSDLPFYEATCWEELQRCARLCALSTAHRFRLPSDTPSNTRFTGNADLSTLDILNMVCVNSSYSQILDDSFRFKLATPLPPFPANARPVHLFSNNNLCDAHNLLVARQLCEQVTQTLRQPAHEYQPFIAGVLHPKTPTVSTYDFIPDLERQQLYDNISFQSGAGLSPTFVEVCRVRHRPLFLGICRGLRWR